MKFAVFVSGHGGNLQAIIDACEAGEIQSELALVFSNKRKALGLERARKAGIKTLFLNPKDYTNPQSFDRDIAIHLKEEGIDFVVLAGYMKLLSAWFIKKYPKKILNIHPSLLPAFKGKQGVKDAFTYGAKVTGVTVHFVDEMTDHGPIILQEAVTIDPKDDLESLLEKIAKVEHKLYKQAIALFEQGRLKIKGRKVHITEDSV